MPVWLADLACSVHTVLMRRAVCVAALLIPLALTPSASAQDATASSTPTVPPPTTGVMLPVPPLPTIGLPLPHIGLPDTANRKTPTDSDGAAEPSSPQPRGPRRRVAVPPVVVYAPVIVGADTTTKPGLSTSKPAAAATRTGRTGTLAFDTKDDDTPFLVFVDGAYLGASDDLGTSLTLPAGSHEIEVQADGRPSTRVSVRIASGKTTTHEISFGAREDGAPAPVAQASAVDSGRVYIIPGCYAGNVPPVAATLRAGCDAAKVTLLER